jgi:hypothetical protein
VSYISIAKIKLESKKHQKQIERRTKQIKEMRIEEVNHIFILKGEAACSPR